MNILAFGASNSANSINTTLAVYAANLIEGAVVEALDINDYEMPIFSMEREKALGQPREALAFTNKIANADAIIISFAEHNGGYTAAYKNLFDWASRVEKKVFQNKPTVYLSTSPGPGGAATVLSSAVGSAPHFAADLRDSVSVPSFHDNFDLEANKMVNSELQLRLEKAVAAI